MTRFAIPFAFAMILYVASPIAQAFATSHVRPPNAALRHPISTDTELTGGEIAAWVQAVGSVVAVLLAIFVGWWQFHQSHGLAKAQRESEDRDRKLKARSLALALYPDSLK